MIEVLTFGTVVGLFVAGVWSMGGLIFDPNEGPPAHALGDTAMTEPGFEARCGPASADPFIVTWVHSPDIEAWISPASAAFMRQCPNTQIRLQSINDIEAARGIVQGDLQPNVWTPSDRSMLDYLDARWQHEHVSGSPELKLERGPSLLQTPMVLLIWHERVELLDSLSEAGLRGPGSWASSSCAGVTQALADANTLEQASMVPASWEALWREAHPAPAQLPAEPSLETLAGWGRVRVAHASPLTSPVGVLALYLISREQLEDDGVALDGPRTGAAIHAQREQLEAWLRRCEAGLDAPLPSARLLTETMFNLGDPALDPRGFDAVITTEQLAFAVLERINDREPALRAVELAYPEGSLMLDYPVAMLGEASPEVRGTAERFTEFLLREDSQARALEQGFRPTNPNLSLRDYDLGANPFASLRRHGVLLDPELKEVERSEGSALLELIELWRAATGR